jgi:hypothetical protein
MARLLHFYRPKPPASSSVAPLTHCKRKQSNPPLVGSRACPSNNGRRRIAPSAKPHETTTQTIAALKRSKKPNERANSCSWHSHATAFPKVAPTGLMMCVLIFLRSRLLTFLPAARRLSKYPILLKQSGANALNGFVCELANHTKPFNAKHHRVNKGWLYSPQTLPKDVLAREGSPHQLSENKPNTPINKPAVKPLHRIATIKPITTHLRA